MVTDNAANIVSAVRITGWNHVPYFAHTLNLIVSEATKNDHRCDDLKTRCRQMVTFFHQSTKAMEKVKAVQDQACSGSGHPDQAVKFSILQ